MGLTDQEKEELFTEFALRYSEMDKEDKREATARNNSCMKDLTKYWEERTHRTSSITNYEEDNLLLCRKFDGRWYFAAEGLYNAYLAIRKVVPLAVGAKYSLEGKKIAGSCPGYKRTYVLDPEKDRDEATEIGKRLIDTLLDYLKEATEQPGYSNADDEEDKK
jgi:hypothetical protein